MQKYKNIPWVEIITQDNKGISAARNTGIKTIKGKYLFFADSDDMVIWNGIEKMFFAAIKASADVVVGGYHYMSEGGTITGSVMNNKKGFPWGKLFKAELFETFCFPEQYWFEDSLINHLIEAKASKVVECGEYVYKYRNNPKGTTNNLKANCKTIDSLYITLSLYRDRIKLNIPLSQEYYDRILMMTWLTLYRVRSLDESIMKNIFIVFSYFIQNEFKGFETKDKRLKPLEKYIKEGSYKRWKIYCLTLKI